MADRGDAHNVLPMDDDLAKLNEPRCRRAAGARQRQHLLFGGGMGRLSENVS